MDVDAIELVVEVTGIDDAATVDDAPTPEETDKLVMLWENAVPEIEIDDVDAIELLLELELPSEIHTAP